MKISTVFTSLTLYTFRLMKEASDLEVRLTTYLLTFIGYAQNHTCFMYTNELHEGQEFFDNDGSRTMMINGVGIPRKKIQRAISEVNKRGLINIKQREENLLVISLNIKFLENESKKHLAHW